MAKILYLNGSPIPKNNSKSHAIATKFIDEYQLLNPKDEIIVRDLNELNVPILTSKNMSTFWETSDTYINELLSVDKLIINVPMINFSIPTIVKNWLDLVCLANKTFTYKYVKETNETGLVKNIKSALIINTTGGTIEKYPFANIDGQLKSIFNFLGIKNIDSINVQGLKMTPKSEWQIADLLKDLDSEIKKKVTKF
ncbi:FMN-dependent NADH-azoreductase [Spiroplasma endosymbiont of Othius punctulatus]|uniref:FMN-dependent NADH-azoreductase n=1 Tax=Spiroplasma endosymbiont of Othius punctulatus TaxID=3066289 RepID=UPI0030CACCE9